MVLRELLRMPAAAIFLADGHVLSAHDLAALLELRHADIAADALADVLDAPFGDLGGQERIRDRGAGGADDVEHAGAYQCDHVVGLVRRPLPTTGMPGPKIDLPCLMKGVIQPDLRKREAPASSPHSA